MTASQRRALSILLAQVWDAYMQLDPATVESEEAADELAEIAARLEGLIEGGG